jgi:hypothetical protein
MNHEEEKFSVFGFQLTPEVNPIMIQSFPPLSSTLTVNLSTATFPMHPDQFKLLLFVASFNYRALII